MRRPRLEEYARPYRRYIDLVPGVDILAMLEAQKDAVRKLRALSAEQAGYRYAKGKWSVREVVGHLSDNERVFAYRMLCLGRGDTAPLKGFDHDAYVAAARFDEKRLSDLVGEFLSVREATISLGSSLDSQALDRIGTASGAALSPRAAMFISAEHVEHHLRILRERYLGFG